MVNDSHTTLSNSDASHVQVTVIYFNKVATITRGGRENVLREVPAAVQIRAIDLALSSTGQFGSQRRWHKGNGRTQLALWPPALIIISIRKKKKTDAQLVT